KGSCVCAVRSATWTAQFTRPHKTYSTAATSARFTRSVLRVLLLLCTISPLQRCYELVALRRREGQQVPVEVVDDVRVLLLVVADDGLLPGRRVQHQAHDPRAVVLEHVVAARQLPVGAVQVERQRRHGHGPPPPPPPERRRRRQREAEVQRRAGLRADHRQPDLRHELRLHRLVHVLRQRRDRRARVDDRRPQPPLRHRQPLRADADALQREEVERRLRGVLEQRGGLEGGAAPKLGRRAERHQAALGLEHGREAVGEAGDAELRRQRPPAPPEAGNAGLVRLEDALVEVAAAERQPPLGAAVGIAEGEAVGGELADGERLVAVVVDVDAAPLAPAPSAAAARRERERAAQRRVAGERGVGGGPGGVQERHPLIEAVEAGRALRPDEVAAGVERERHGPRRRAQGQVHQVLVRHDAAAAAGAEAGAHRPVRPRLRLPRRQQPPPARPGPVRHPAHELGPREPEAGVGVREQRRDPGARSGRGERRQREQDQQRGHELP
uniref:Uncharacterized protein n=1 Tax=Triticum urartu TaxID=4572 RepID=A0A8R7R0V9_TRIUA